MTGFEPTTGAPDSGNPLDDSDLGSLIPIGASEIGGATIRTVDLRTVHAYVQSGRSFSNWIRDRIASYGFIDGVDFVCTDEHGNPVNFLLNNSGDREDVGQKKGVTLRIDYHGTIGMAKELCMVENNEHGRRARGYFLRMERIAQDPMHALRDPNALRGLLLVYTEKALFLQGKVAELQPQADALDRIAGAGGSMCITDAAKHLQVRPKDLFDYLRANRWIYKRAGAKHDVGYQPRIASGDLIHKVETVLHPDGHEIVREQVRLTARGIAKLAKLMPPAVRDVAA